MEFLDIGTFQYDIAWEDPKKNLGYLESNIESPAQLLILPEMFTTGFSMNPENLNVDMDSEFILAIQHLSDQYQKYIMGSMIISESNRYYNRLILFGPTAKPQYYDKRHLFSYGAEDQHYSAGTQDGIFMIEDWKICGRICYDLRFPAWSRNIYDYDLLVYVANWPSARQKAWNNLLIARAIENQSYVAGVNRIGKDENGLHYSGGSVVINYAGEVLSESNDQEIIKCTRLIKKDLRDYRDRFPFLQDRDEISFR